MPSSIKTQWHGKSCFSQCSHSPSPYTPRLQACSVVLMCLTLGDPMDCSLPDSSVHGDFPGKNTRVGCHFLSPRDLPIPGIEPTLLESPALADGFFTTNTTWGDRGFSEIWARLILRVCEVAYLIDKSSPCCLPGHFHHFFLPWAWLLWGMPPCVHCDLGVLTVATYFT